MAVAPRFVGYDIDQSSADPAPPLVWLDEQTVQLGEAIVALDHSKARNLPANFGDGDLTALDKGQRQLDRVQMRLKMRAVFCICEGRAPLQLLQQLAFERSRLPKPDLSAP